MFLGNVLTLFLIFAHDAGQGIGWMAGVVIVVHFQGRRETPTGDGGKMPPVPKKS